MARHRDRFAIILRNGNRRTIVKGPLRGIRRLIFILNRQYTNAPNTTQIASGAGHSNAAGSNAAIHSPKTKQQQSVGSGGTALNLDRKGKSSRTAFRRNPAPSTARPRHRADGKEVVVVVNEQIVKLPQNMRNASATQVAGGAGKYGTSGTNAAISSPGTRQQHAVGGGGTAVNRRNGSKAGRRRKTR